MTKAKEYVAKDAIIKALEKSKTLTDEGRRTGKWLSTKRYIGTIPMRKCSECSSILMRKDSENRYYQDAPTEILIPMLDIFKYCPVCSAQMTPEKDGEK